MVGRNRASVIAAFMAGALTVLNFGCGGGTPTPANPVGPAISVSLSSTTATFGVGTTGQFAATVTNDSANKGVNWTLSCSPAPCGSVSPTSTVSGGNTTYTPPATSSVATLTVTLTAASATDPTVTASATITAIEVTVQVSPGSASVPSGGTQQFTGTVTGDPNKAGVTWSLQTVNCDLEHGCAIGYVHVSPCNSSCGTVSPASTASGAAMTYAAPSAPPFRPSYLHHMQLVATSIATSYAGYAVSLGVLPISVSASPSPAKVALTKKQQFTASVTNDGTMSGVTWSLMQNGIACAPGCGTISPTKTASNAATTYTAPATVPGSPLLSVIATSVEDTTTTASAPVTFTTSTGGLACGAGSGSESLLLGRYAFLLHGFLAPHGEASPMAGSITADGAGKIVGGEEDIEIGGNFGTDLTINSAGSLYAVGPDHRGCMVLTNSGGETTALLFALGTVNPSSIATAGHLTEVDDTIAMNAPRAGTVRLQDPSSFVPGGLKGSYAFGVVGGIGGRVAEVGTFTSDGVSTITSSESDANAGLGVVNSSSASAGSFTCCSANGRATLQFADATGGNDSFVMYVINSGDAFLTAGGAYVSGEAIGIPSGVTFSASSLNGSAVLSETVQEAAGPVVDLATVSTDGSSAFTTKDNTNSAGVFSTGSTTFTYQVAANGRVTLGGTSTPPILYLYGPNQGFLVGTDANVTFGILEPQSGGPFSDSSFSGAYFFGTENPSASTVTLQSGAVTADGSGTATGTSDQSSSSGLVQNQTLNLNYSVAADGTGNVGTGTTAIMISPSKLAYINNTDPNPTITVVEK